MTNLIIEYDATLSDLLEREGTTNGAVADMLGLTKDSIRQMAASNRQIYLREIDGLWHYCEVKRWRRAPKPEGGRGRPRNLQLAPVPKPKAKPKPKPKARRRRAA